MKQKWHESKWEPELNWATEGGLHLLLMRMLELGSERNLRTGEQA